MQIIIDEEFRSLIPPLSAEESQQLTVNLLRDGVLDPLKVWQETGILVDGHNRHEICTTHEITIPAPQLISFKDRDAAKEWIIKNQFGRRNLNDYQKAELVLRLEPLLRRRASEVKSEAATERQNKIRDLKEKLTTEDLPFVDRLLIDSRIKDLTGESHKESRREQQRVYFALSGNRIKIGFSETPDFRVKELRCSDPDIELIADFAGGRELEKELHIRFEARWIDGEWFEACQEIFDEIERLSGLSKIGNSTTPYHVHRELARLSGVGHSNVAKVKVIAEKASEETKALLRKGKLSIAKAHAAIVEEERKKEVESEQYETNLCDDLLRLVEQNQKFACIYADPPWQYGNQATRAATDNHYPTMSMEELIALPVDDVAADNAHLHLWTTNGFIQEAFVLMQKWGFEYKSMFLWVKPQMGIGNYWRVSHEIMLLGVRGKCPFQDRSQMSWGQFDRTKHSAKPEEIRKMIEKVSPGPRLELFGRSEIDGWTVFGNQIKRDLFSAGLEKE